MKSVTMALESERDKSCILICPQSRGKKKQLRGEKKRRKIKSRRGKCRPKPNFTHQFLGQAKS